MSRIKPLSAAILAGGQSRRMGRDKALLTVAGRTLLEIVADRAATVADDVFIVAKDRPEYARLGLPIIADVIPASGSLGGIYTALLRARHPYCLVLACDMPFVNIDLLAYMASAQHDYDVLIPALPNESDERGASEMLETMHAIYSRRCIPFIRRRVDEGRFKIADLLNDVRVQRIEAATIRCFDPLLSSFINVNTPAEYEALRSGSA